MRRLEPGQKLSILGGRRKPCRRRQLAPAAYPRNPGSMAPAPIQGRVHVCLSKCLHHWRLTLRTAPVEWLHLNASLGRHGSQGSLAPRNGAVHHTMLAGSENLLIPWRRRREDRPLANRRQKTTMIRPMDSKLVESSIGMRRQPRRQQEHEGYQSLRALRESTGAANQITACRRRVRRRCRRFRGCGRRAAPRGPARS
jgi:hypothetical protein